jgi:putative hemolysin
MGDPGLYLELSIVAALILLNGLLALSELAVVSARRAKLKAMADRGVRGARTAIDLAADPGRFLSTVQIGITLVGVLNGAFSGATLADRLSASLAGFGVRADLADPVAFGLVVTLITYVSLIVGELVPKQIALRDAEGIAARVAPAMAILSRIASPFVAVLDVSGRFILKLIGATGASSQSVTEEEIRTVIAEAETAGVLEASERDMIAGVLRLGDRSVRSLMTPRRDVVMVDLAAGTADFLAVLGDASYSCLPATRGNPDDVVGVVQVKDIARAALAGEAFDPSRHLLSAPVVPDTLDAMDALTVLKLSAVPIALVHDEYGHFEGIITPTDILEAIAGSFQSDDSTAVPAAVQRADGSWLIEGAMPADEMADLLGVRLPDDADYHTVAGFLLAAMGRLPGVGDDVVAQGYRFEVVDLDGRRIDKVLVERLPTSHRL